MQFYIAGKSSLKQILFKLTPKREEQDIKKIKIIT